MKKIITLALLVLVLTSTESRIRDQSKKVINPTSKVNEVVKPIFLENRDSIVIEDLIRNIKFHETMHKSKHWPYVGYGHMVLKGEKYTSNISEKEAEKLLRKDLANKMSFFKGSFKERLLLGALSYNIGQGKILKSTLYKMIKTGGYSKAKLKAECVKWCHYNGKFHKKINQRRNQEFDIIFK